MASRSLGSLTLDLIAKVGGFTGPIDKAARDLDRQTRGMQKSVSALTGSLKTLGAGVAGFFAGLATGAVSLDAFFQAINQLDRLDELSAKTGISTEELSKLGYAAKLTGTDLEDLNTSFDKLAKSAVKALDPTSKQAEIFKALGVSVTDAQGNLKTTDDLIKEVATGFKALNDDTLEAAAAQELFGKSGAGLLEFLNLGADGLTAMGQKASDLGAVFDEETTKAAADLKDEIDNLKTVLGALVIDVLKPLLPLLRDTAVELQGVAKEAGGAGGAAQSAGEDLAELFTSIKSLGTGTITVLSQMREVLNGLQDQAVGYTNLILGRAGALQQIRASGDRIANALSGPAAQTPLPDTSYLETPAYLRTDGGAFRFTGERFSVVKDAIVDEKALAKAISGTKEAKEKRAKATKGETEAEKKFREEILEVNDLIDEISRDKQSDLFFDRQSRTEDQQAFLSDLAFEGELLGKTAEQQEVLNNLRYAGADANSDYGRSIIATTEAIQAQREATEQQIAIMDTFRLGLEDAFVDLVSGAKSFKDAFLDMVDSIIASLTKLIAQNLIEQAFGQMGSTGAGSSGGWISAFAGLFAGGRATGGPVAANRLYRVNESGAEMLSVGGRDYLMMGNQGGTVTPSGRFGGAITVNNTYVNPFMNDPRSEAQRQQEEGVRLRLATRNS